MPEVSASGSARFISGRVVDAVRTGGGIEGTGSSYFVRGEDDELYVCDYTDLVTEGFRTLLVGDIVRFVPSDDGVDLRATQVLKIDEPVTDDYYAEGVDPMPGAASDRR